MKPHLIRLSLLITIAALFSNCKKPTVFKEVQVTSLFTLQVPSYLQAASENFPFPVALQYNNDSAKVYLMVLDTTRAGMNENMLKTYYDSMVSEPFIDSAKITPPQLVKVNGDSAYISEMTGRENGIKVFFEMEAIATPQRYYMVITWGREAKKEELKPDMQKMLGSFRDISRKKI